MFTGIITDLGTIRSTEQRGRVVYELHIGTFTPEGTWAAAAEQLPRLAELGVNVIEVMPVADFPGRFGWGYDGVNLFAPTRLYRGLEDVTYPFADATVMVTHCGRICFHGRKINLSHVFAGQGVGVTQVGDHVWLVTFMQYDLGYFDDEAGRVEPIENPFSAEVLPMCSE